jgi:hypothetical protein
VIPDMEALVGNTIARILADKGYRGHNTPPDYKFGYFSRANARGDAADQARIAPQVRRRAVIGHLKAEHRMGRNYLWFRESSRLPNCVKSQQSSRRTSDQPKPEIRVLHGLCAWCILVE